MSQNIFRITKSLAHLLILTLERLTKFESVSLVLFVNIGDNAQLRTQYYLSLVQENYLNDFVAQSKHNCVFSFEPLFDIDIRRRLLVSLKLKLTWLRQILDLFISFQVGPEVLQ